MVLLSAPPTPLVEITLKCHSGLSMCISYFTLLVWFYVLVINPHITLKLIKQGWKSEANTILHYCTLTPPPTFLQVGVECIEATVCNIWKNLFTEIDYIVHNCVFIYV